MRLAAQRFEESECESCIQAFKHRKSCPLPRLRDEGGNVSRDSRWGKGSFPDGYIISVYIHDMFGKAKNNDAKSDQSTSVCGVLRGVSSFKTQMHDSSLGVDLFFRVCGSKSLHNAKKTTAPKSAVRSTCRTRVMTFQLFFRRSKVKEQKSWQESAVSEGANSQ